jgi:hypothetical protein
MAAHHPPRPTEPGGRNRWIEGEVDAPRIDR